MRANIKTQPSFFNPLSETGRLQAQMCRWRGVGLAREARLSPRPGGEAVPSRPRPRAGFRQGGVAQVGRGPPALLKFPGSQIIQRDFCPRGALPPL